MLRQITHVMKPQALMLNSERTPGSAPQELIPAAAPVRFWPQLLARIQSWFEIPYGYEDEKGFHYGKPSKPHAATSGDRSEARVFSVFTDRACDAIVYASALAPKPEETKPDSVVPAALSSPPK